MDKVYRATRGVDVVRESMAPKATISVTLTVKPIYPNRYYMDRVKGDISPTPVRLDSSGELWEQTRWHAALIDIDTRIRGLRELTAAYERGILSPEGIATSYVNYYNNAERAITCLLEYIDPTGDCINRAAIPPSQPCNRGLHGNYEATLDALSKTNNPLYRLLGDGVAHEFLQDAKKFRDKHKDSGYHPTTSELASLAFERRAKCLEDSLEVALSLAKGEANSRSDQCTFWEQARSLEWALAATELKAKLLEREMKESESATEERFENLKQEHTAKMGQQICKMTEQAKEVARLKMKNSKLQKQNQGQAEIDQLQMSVSMQDSAVNRVTDEKQLLAGKVGECETDNDVQATIIANLQDRISELEQALKSSKRITHPGDAATKRPETELKRQQDCGAQLATNTAKTDKCSLSCRRFHDAYIKQNFNDPLAEIVRLIEPFPFNHNPPGSWDAISLQLLKMVDGRKPLIGKLAVAIAFLGFALDKARKDKGQHSYELYDSRLKNLKNFRKILHNAQVDSKALAEAYVKWYNNVEEDIRGYFQVLGVPLALSGQNGHAMNPSVATLEALHRKGSPFRPNLGQSEVVSFLHGARKFRDRRDKDPLSPQFQNVLPDRNYMARQVRVVHEAMHDCLEALKPNEGDRSKSPDTTAYSSKALDTEASSSHALDAQADKLREKEAKLREWEAHLEKRENVLQEEERRLQQERTLQEEKINSEKLARDRPDMSEDLIDMSGDTGFSQDSASHIREFKTDFAGIGQSIKCTRVERAQTLETTRTDERGVVIEGVVERLKRLEEENEKLREGLQVVINAASQGALMSQHEELRQMIIAHRHLHGRTGAEASKMYSNSSDSDKTDLPHLVRWLMADQTHAIVKQRAASHKVTVLEGLYERLQDRLENYIASWSRYEHNTKAFLLDNMRCGSPQRLVLRQIIGQNESDQLP
ncbi:MAG: hypothetical protein Q9217_002090 [Psora testacea]